MVDHIRLLVSIPPSVTGRLPWRTSPQKHYGVYRLDGSEKPVAKLLQSGNKVQVPTLYFLTNI